MMGPSLEGLPVLPFKKISAHFSCQNVYFCFLFLNNKKEENLTTTLQFIKSLTFAVFKDKNVPDIFSTSFPCLIMGKRHFFFLSNEFFL